ncbi:hypothetical protein QYE76_046697 [Lolium multiflorum]|uniref:CCHC-type domain-containing protein n=1 Tax=Lolium multiflorum TaxID=4521 RepID=A0AAD8WZE8_LOLMU|nr:hypothetical protein QYE76_046697 [Lolium multiflorum]
MENYSLLMGDSNGDEDGGGVDGEAFQGHFPVPAACRNETPVPQILASRWWRLWKRGHVRESLEMIMQRFLHGLKYDIKGIVRHHSYTTMNELLHHAREAESQLAEEAQIKGRATGAGCYTPRPSPSTAPAPSSRSASYSTLSSKPVSNVSNTKKSELAASMSGSSMSTARNRDMNCHTCGDKGHFKRDCPNRKVMIINEDNEYETGDDVDPYAPEDDDYDIDDVDAYPSEARTIVVSQRALNVLPSASTQCCNLFQTKALVGSDKACKVIIDGGSCRNLASKELCTKLKLKYLPHPHPYYIQWLSDNGEMKVNHMVRVEFEIGPYKDSIDFDAVPMTEIFSKLDETKAQGLIFHGAFQKTEGDTKWGHEVATPQGGAAKEGPVPPYGVGPSYEERASIARGGEEQLDKKLDVKLDMKTSHGSAREEREACARGEEEVQAGARRSTGRHAGAAGPRPGQTGRPTGPARRRPDPQLVPTEHYPLSLDS